MPSNHQLVKYILVITGLFTLAIGVLIFMHPPAMYPDPSYGFQVMRSMQMGAPFNTLVSPNPANIAQDSHRFLSWWSPGQYLAPYFFMNLFKLNLGQAIAIVVSLCSFSGLAGLYVFFKKVGFTPLVSAISIAFIASQQGYFIPFIFYNGGEVLLFAFVGWFLYGCAAFTRANWQAVIFIFLSGLIGFFCKSSFMWIYLSGTLYLWIRLSQGKKFGGWIVNGFITGVPAVLSLAIIQFTYLAKGDNPASDSMGIKLVWETFSFPLASPLLAAFSIDDLADGIINYGIIILLVLALLSVVLVVYCYKKIPNINYTWLLLILYAVGVLFYGINFLRQANISYEARHMRTLGLIITPGIIYLLSLVKPRYWSVFILAWLFIGYKNYKFIPIQYHSNAYEAQHGRSGIAQLFIDKPTLDYITTLDKQQRDVIFAFISADLGLEIAHNRTITLPEVDDDLQADRPIDIFNGHSGPVYLVLPKWYNAAKLNFYAKCFPGYTNFTLQKQGNDYVVYLAN